MRVVIADDSMLMRQGLARLLSDAGCDVVATAEDSRGLLREIQLTAPDAAIIDIKMPPTHTDEGIIAAPRIRLEYPAMGVLVLSQYLDAEYALLLIPYPPQPVGSLPHPLVPDVAVLVAALNRLRTGRCPAHHHRQQDSTHHNAPSHTLNLVLIIAC